MILGSRAVRNYSVADLMLFFLCILSACAVVPLVVLRVAQCIAAQEEARGARVREERRERLHQRQLRRCEEFVVSDLDVGDDGCTSSETEHGNCAICLESFQVGELCRKLPCRHVFHAECCEGWLREHHSCPNCRCDVRAPEDIQEADAAVAQAAQRHRRFRCLVVLTLFGAFLWRWVYY
eukprot:gnl/MRDRNA2_/MRDRNA2_195059_c0_seq1.p1 gnl/MRDRNA2_/MRDRNA2_195059_c0~~gnl/MRDRNA2_/MRDRNA2_195059_c0_seq1.p1  ORF type:complete len:180 (+),score=26.45 gnl/MRDRNA2_/MRDRNA2_195059_c0_seq1:245-784(+)